MTETKDYKDSLRRFLNESEKKKKEKRDELLRIVRSEVQVFVQKFNSVEEVSIIGSVAKEVFYTTRSDVDILVKGLKKTDYFEAFRFWEDRLPVGIDLIREEEVGEGVKAMLKEKVVIYEKD